MTATRPRRAGARATQPADWSKIDPGARRSACWVVTWTLSRGRLRDAMAMVSEEASWRTPSSTRGPDTCVGLTMRQETRATSRSRVTKEAAEGSEHVRQIGALRVDRSFATPPRRTGAALETVLPAAVTSGENGLEHRPASPTRSVPRECDLATPGPRDRAGAGRREPRPEESVRGRRRSGNRGCTGDATTRTRKHLPDDVLSTGVLVVARAVAELGRMTVSSSWRARTGAPEDVAWSRTSGTRHTWVVPGGSRGCRRRRARWPVGRGPATGQGPRRPRGARRDTRMMVPGRSSRRKQGADRRSS